MTICNVQFCGYSVTPEGLAYMLVEAGIIPPCDESEAREKIGGLEDAYNELNGRSISYDEKA